MLVGLTRTKKFIPILASLLMVQYTARAADCTMSARAAHLVEMIDRATLEMLDANGNDDPAPKGGRHLDWPPHCSAFLRAFMRELGSNGAYNVNPTFTDEKNPLNADAFGSAMPESKDWSKVNDWNNAQSLANTGTVVVGYIKGHVGVVFPIPDGLDVSSFAGSGPFVRDGNEHPVNKDLSKRLFPSSYGAVHASEAFGRLSQISWYELNQTAPSTYESIIDRMRLWLASTQTCKQIESQQTGFIGHWTGKGAPRGTWVYFEIPLPHSYCSDAISCSATPSSDDFTELTPGRYSVSLMYSETNPAEGPGYWGKVTGVTREIIVKPGKVTKLDIP